MKVVVENKLLTITKKEFEHMAFLEGKVNSVGEFEPRYDSVVREFNDYVHTLLERHSGGHIYVFTFVQ